MPAQKIDFRPILPEDFILLKNWQKQPHVVEFWGDSEEWDESYEEYVYNSNDGSVVQLIIELNGRSIGYFQYYWAAKVGDGWWENLDDKTVGLDMYIGEADLIGCGLGKMVLNAARKMLEKIDGVEKIIADPCPNNERMIHVLEAVGFHKNGICDTPDGPAVLMIYHKND